MKRNVIITIGALAPSLSMLLACGGVGGLSSGGVETPEGEARAPAPPPPPRPPAEFKPPAQEVAAVLHDAVGPLAFAPDGRTLVTCKKDDPGSLMVWDLSGSKPRVHEESSGHSKLIWAMAFSPDGKTLATCSLDETVRLWELDSHGPQTVRQWHNGPTDSIAWASGGKTLVCSGGDDKQGGDNWLVRFWDVNGTKPHEKGTFNGGTPIAVSPDGKTLASAWSAEVKLWNLAGTKTTERASLHGHSGTITGFAFSPDSKLLVSVAKDRGVRLWDLAENDERALCEGYNDAVMYVAWASSGKMFATAGESKPGRIVLWNRQGKKVKEWSVPNNDIYSSHIAFSADSKWLAFPVVKDGDTAVYIMRIEFN